MVGAVGIEMPAMVVRMGVATNGRDNSFGCCVPNSLGVHGKWDGPSFGPGPHVGLGFRYMPPLGLELLFLL